MKFKKTFEADGTAFGANNKAENWLKDNGYSYGSFCVGGPQGVMMGDCDIAKWGNLSPAERRLMDGTLHCGRNQDVVLRLKVAPE
jgi:hypothetical protein